MRKFWMASIMALAIAACGGAEEEPAEDATMEETVPPPAPAPAPVDTAMIMDTTVTDTTAQ